MANQNQESSKRQVGECKLIGLLFIWYYSMIGVLIILGLRRRQHDKTNLLQNSTTDINETNTFKVSSLFTTYIYIEIEYQKYPRTKLHLFKV